MDEPAMTGPAEQGEQLESLSQEELVLLARRRQTELEEARRQAGELGARVSEQALQIAALQSEVAKKPALAGADQPATPPAPAAEKPRWDYRFAFPVRTAHWINVIALLCMVMSGLQIFNAHPSLYLSDDSNPAHRILSIDTVQENGQTFGDTEIWGRHFNTSGVLGLQFGPEHTLMTNAFPQWMMLGGWLGGGRHWHFFFLWVFLINGLIYTTYKFLSGDGRRMIFRPADVKGVLPMVRYYLHLDREHPRVGKYNALQKQAYSAVWLLIAPLILITGLAMSPAANAAFPFLVPLLGGRQLARTLHFLAMAAFVGFVVVHLTMVLTTGLRNNLRAMTLGWYRLSPHELSQAEEDTERTEATA